MKHRLITSMLLIYMCNINADNFIGWSNGISYRKHISMFIIEISTNPSITNLDSDSDSFDDYDSDSRNSANLGFHWLNSIFLGRTVFIYDKFKLNSGLNLGYVFQWQDRESMSSDESWSRQWDEEHQLKIGVTFRPSFNVFDRIILETDYGIQYIGVLTESKSESISEFLNQTQIRTQYNKKYFQRYELIGRTFGLDMGFKVYLKI